MVVKVHTALLQGLEGVPVTVEVSQGRGLPAFFVVGLGDAAVLEARRRVESAIQHSGFTFPARKVTINLAPASIAKKGACFDLPIAIGVLATTMTLSSSLEHTLFFGELSLDGHVRAVPGALGMVEFARSRGYTHVVFPVENYAEVAAVRDITLCPVASLGEAVAVLGGSYPTLPEQVTSSAPLPVSSLCFEHIQGHEFAKRALTIAVAGGHNVLMIGPPGTGKSILAKAVMSILPALSFEEAMELTKLYSIAKALPVGHGLLQQRPFRVIHPSVSPLGLLGGGASATPGEITLAHRGVLYMDEWGEFPRSLLEQLRQPLEEQCITLSRALYKVSYPAAFQLIATSNPCPCGYSTHPRTPCTCTPSARTSYLQRFSGPLMDRCDMLLSIEKQTATTHTGPDSATCLESVAQARALQYERQGMLNQLLSSSDLERFAFLEPALRSMLESAIEAQDGSKRAVHRVWKVARTIADLEHSINIGKNHILEALQYKRVYVTPRGNSLSG